MGCTEYWPPLGPWLPRWAMYYPNHSFLFHSQSPPLTAPPPRLPGRLQQAAALLLQAQGGKGEEGGLPGREGGLPGGEGGLPGCQHSLPQLAGAGGSLHLPRPVHVLLPPGHPRPHHRGRGQDGQVGTTPGTGQSRALVKCCVVWCCMV